MSFKRLMVDIRIVLNKGRSLRWKRNLSVIAKKSLKVNLIIKKIVLIFRIIAVFPKLQIRSMVILAKFMNEY